MHVASTRFGLGSIWHIANPIGPQQKKAAYCFANHLRAQGVQAVVFDTRSPNHKMFGANVASPYVVLTDTEPDQYRPGASQGQKELTALKAAMAKLSEEPEGWPAHSYRVDVADFPLDPEYTGYQWFLHHFDNLLQGPVQNTAPRESTNPFTKKLQGLWQRVGKRRRDDNKMIALLQPSSDENKRMQFIVPMMTP